MLDEKDLERYRRMTPEERFEVFRKLMDFAWQSMLELPQDERSRRLEWIDREHAEGNDRIEAKLRTLP